MKDPVEVRPPGDDRLFLILRVVTSRDYIPFIPLDKILPDLVYSPVWELDEKIARRVHRRFDSRREFLNHL